jgi:hypothetical protein
LHIDGDQDIFASFPGGKYNPKSIISSAKRRGKIIKCCGFSKCEPALTSNRTIQDRHNRPKSPKNNNTAAGPGNVKSQIRIFGENQ